VVAYRDEGDNPKFDPLPFDTANRLDSKLTADQRKNYYNNINERTKSNKTKPHDDSTQHPKKNITKISKLS
ncbi:unnamed protein product, partial [Rotaria socialis]